MFNWIDINLEKPTNTLSAIVYWDAVKCNYVLSNGDYEGIKENIKDCTHWALLLNPPEASQS